MTEEVATSTTPQVLGDSIVTLITVPAGFMRTTIEASTFGHYLRNLSLKAPGTSVHHFDGSLKRNQSAHFAVIDMEVGTRDLQQCADAIMRLRAEYLWQQKKYQAIAFHFTNGFLASYARWRGGERIQVTGNQVKWVQSSSRNSSISYQSFRKYLNMVFAYAGTLSLAKELNTKSLDEIEIGDVFIQGGSPGHAVIVVDMAVHTETGEKLVLLAQSYMPAQDIHVLVNPSDVQRSPWYTTNEMKGIFRTPEWDFSDNDLKSFD
ncbi:MAG: DUF4846 domain-containing protein [Bacteroidota bacterium]